MVNLKLKNFTKIKDIISYEHATLKLKITTQIYIICFKSCNLAALFYMFLLEYNHQYVPFVVLLHLQIYRAVPGEYNTFRAPQSTALAIYKYNV